MIINDSYFTGEISLPSSQYDNKDALIARYEPEILKRVLGYELWKLVDADQTTPKKIKDIVDGKEYTVLYNGRDSLVKWNGLKNSDLKSFIAYYCYFMWQKNNSTFTSNNGEADPYSENSESTSPAQKMGRAWFLMRELIGYKGQHVLEPSLYNFLTENESTYPEWVFREVESVNMFGI